MKNLILKVVDWLSVLWNRLRGRVRADHLNRKDRRAYEKATGRRILGTNKPYTKYEKVTYEKVTTGYLKKSK